MAEDGKTLPVLSALEGYPSVQSGMQHHDADSIALLSDLVEFDPGLTGFMHHDANALPLQSSVAYYSYVDDPSGDCDIVRDIPRLVRSSP